MGRYRVLALVIASAGIASADGKPDFDRAKQLYTLAEQEMTSGHYTEAVNDFGGAYEITKDPVLFYKIGIANQKLGKCDVALVYFGRYLKEAHPNQKFVALTKDRVAECNAAPAPVQPVVIPDKPIDKPVEKPVEVVTAPVELTPPPPAAHHAHGNKTAWLLVGGAIAFATVGAVLAYSASSSENDISDLYVGLNGVPPTFNASTQARYNDLVDEGHRYQYLSWASFAVAGGAAIAATILFATGGNDHAEHAMVVPVASPNSAGVAASWRF
jgi:tetratricopeptide (TPR) repeat protein